MNEPTEQARREAEALSIFRYQRGERYVNRCKFCLTVWTDPEEPRHHSDCSLPAIATALAAKDAERLEAISEKGKAEYALCDCVIACGFPHPGDSEGMTPDECSAMVLVVIREKDAEIQRLSDHVDLMVDEFKRIKALEFDSEVSALCERAITQAVQRVPVIQQRDDWKADYESASKRSNEWQEKHATQSALLQEAVKAITETIPRLNELIRAYHCHVGRMHTQCFDEARDSLKEFLSKSAIVAMVKELEK